MNFQVIVTLGPSILKEDTLKTIDSIGPCIYRINGAHEGGVDVVKMVQFVRGVLPQAKFLLDLPGNKVRVRLAQPLMLVKGERVRIRPDQLNFEDFYRYLKKGDKVFANDSVYTLEVEEIERDNTLVLLSHSDGPLGNNKGLHVPGFHHQIPFVFPKDMELMEAGTQAAVDYFGVSFVRTADDIREIKKILTNMGNSVSHLLAKVETLSAVKNLGHIFSEVEEILVDRGDLSTDVGLFELASYQERIVEAAKRAGKRIFLATQFLKNMEHSPIPLIAEIIDLHKTVKSGINGIQLSEETAVGKYPVDCVRNVFKVYHNSF